MSNNIQKKVFQVSTTDNSNAAAYQDGEVHNWLVELLSAIARQNAGAPYQSGPTVTVIVEVIQ